jgi:AraC-like DNA-binding protein
MHLRSNRDNCLLPNAKVDGVKKNHRMIYRLVYAGILICLVSALSSFAVHAVPANKKHTVKKTKPVFSVSVPDTAAKARKTDTAKSKPVPVAALGHDSVKSAVVAPVADTTCRKNIADSIIVPVVSAQASSATTTAPMVTVPANKPAVVPVPVVNIPVKQGRHFPFAKIIIRLLICAGSLVVVVFAFRFIKKQDAPKRFLTTTRLSIMDKEVQLACRYIEKNYANPDLSVTLVCKSLITGEAFLEALMQRDLGISVEEFIVHVRVNRVKLLLQKNQTLSAEVLAKETGFTNAETLCATFNKITGTTLETFIHASKNQPA